MHEQPSTKPSNLVIFVLLAFSVVMLHSMIFNRGNQPADRKKVAAEADAKPGDKAKQPAADEEKPAQPGADRKEAEDEAGEDAEPEPAALPADAGPVPKEVDPPHYFTLGSADPNSPYRMLVTATDRGAAISRIELNSPRYRTLMTDDGYLAYTGGYLGRISMEPDRLGNGCLVEVVGRGTPAERAGLRPGDLVTAIDGKTVNGAKSLDEAIARKKPGRTVKLTVVRNEQELTKPIEAKLTAPPMEIVRPEKDDPLSFLMTLSQIGKKALVDSAVDANQPKDERPVYVNKEIPGLNLRRGTWEVVSHSADRIEFRCELPGLGLVLTKIYRLQPIPKEKQQDTDYPAYNLTLDVKIQNIGRAKRKVAYQLDGPTGLPIEGWWYANKVGRVNSAGLRDVIVSFNERTQEMVGCLSIAADKVQDSVWHGGNDALLTYIGVDAQYFSVVLIPQRKDSDETWFATSEPLRVGAVDPKILKTTDVTCRMRSRTVDLPAGGEAMEHRFTIFAGPKRPEILTHYGLNELVYYGWFDVFARPMVWVLHFFHGIVLNYGVAILMLTVLVRGLMYPMSRKQALGMQKMAELQPEIKKIQEKYKKDMEARTKAQQELFKKHKYNPMSGCLVLFVQLPIFIGLYNGLRVDVELRGSPLLWSSLRWCSNLSAPDMLFDWHRLPVLREYLTYGVSMFSLGPYFNLLPLATVILFLMQQKLFMPPPADDQQAMQQKMMKYMMLFMGIMFFKVASGLCIYFIASSLWGLAERKLLPKTPRKPDDKKSDRRK